MNIRMVQAWGRSSLPLRLSPLARARRCIDPRGLRCKRPSPDSEAGLGQATVHCTPSGRTTPFHVGRVVRSGDIKSPLPAGAACSSSLIPHNWFVSEGHERPTAVFRVLPCRCGRSRQIRETSRVKAGVAVNARAVRPRRRPFATNSGRSSKTSSGMANALAFFALGHVFLATRLPAASHRTSATTKRLSTYLVLQSD